MPAHGLGAEGGPTVSPSPSRDESVQIQWLAWGEEAFERAKQEDKLILLDLTAVWCHACHVMDETTYVDPAVVNLLNARFIAIRVETDQRPDIEARYKHGGWPTTSILLPSGEIVFQANALTPEEMLEALHASESVYRENKSDMAERAAKIWEQVESAQRAREQPRGPIPSAMMAQILDVMKQQYDPVYGGFRDAPKFFEPEAIGLAFAHHFWHQDSDLLQMALFTLDQQLKLYDPVWGGFFRYAENADWSHPHYEKMLTIQAANLLTYLEAYQITGLAQYREVVEGIMRYVARFLSDRDQGGFYASQDADVRNVGGSDGYVPGEKYFALNESQRLAVGVPYIDRTMFTGWNGLMAKSYLKVHQVLGNLQTREFALKTLRRLYKECYRPGRGMAHLLLHGSPKEFGLLSDQAFFAEALIEAFVTTGMSLYLEQAENIIADSIRLLEDTQGGGFFDRAPGFSSLGLLKFPHKDLRVNAALATVFSDLFYITQKPAYREKARNILQFILGQSGPFPIAQTGLALNRFLQYPVHIVVVGEKSNMQAKNLFSHSLAVYAPGKLVRFLDPQVDSLALGEISFPKTSSPLAYVCTDRLCSSPLSSGEELADHFREIFTAMSDARKPLSERMHSSASEAR